MAEEGNGINGKLDKLVLVVTRLDERSELRHANTVERMHMVEAGLEAVRAAQVSHGTAVAALQQTCLARSDLHNEHRRRADKLSNELGKLREGMTEVSQITKIDDIKRNEWKLLVARAWFIVWRVSVALAGLGVLGAGAAEVFKLLRGE